MRQILFFLPVKSWADNLPDIPLLVPAFILFGGIVFYRSPKGQTLGKKFLVPFALAVGLLFLPAALQILVARGVVDIPIYGYGAMLFIAFILCISLASWLAKKHGVAQPQVIQDLAIWLFIFGILGARLTYMLGPGRKQFNWGNLQIVWEFFSVWDGGLVFYGSFVGGMAGYYLAYFAILKKNNVSSWQMADVIAPSIALGLCVGRLGCLLNGCCYGNVATCAHCPAIGFPLSSPPRFDMVIRGHQTAAGFITRASQIHNIEPLSAAQEAGLKKNDIIVHINGEPAKGEMDTQLVGKWPRGKNDLDLTIRDAAGQQRLVSLRPMTLGLHPTQIYESISMLLVMFVLLAYFPLRRQPGSVLVLFLFCYGIHRFLNEMLRTDTTPVAFDMTLSQNLSILVLAAATVLGLYLRIKTIRAAGRVS